MDASPSAGPVTHFAPAGRTRPDELRRQISACLEDPIVKLVLEATDTYVLVLNESRQILAASRLLLKTIEANDPLCFHGLRPGELLNCVHAAAGADGCGTSTACARCGAVLAILAAQETGESAAMECYLDRYAKGCWEPCNFLVRATPLVSGEHRLMVFTLRNITLEKRSEVQEGIFLHALPGALQELKGWAELLQASGLGDSESGTRDAAARIVILSEHLIQMVNLQQMISKAEKGRLVSNLVTMPVQEIFGALTAAVAGHASTQGRTLEIRSVPGEERLSTDLAILSQILSSMVINALEASAPGGTVRIWFEHRGGRSGFFVHNTEVIPEWVRPRIFQRAFTTKEAPGRGLGTYAMKLLGENVLLGEVGFNSTKGQGTCFHILLSSRT